MKRRLDFGRLTTHNRPEPVHSANVPCVITIWCLPNLEVEQDEKAEFSHVYVGFSMDEATVEHGTPLPEDHPVDIPLEAGEALYASTTDYAYLGYVVTSNE